MNKLRLLIFCGIALGFSPALQAQHSDIDFGYSGGAIDIAFGAEGRLFESNFPTTNPGENFTDDPGFEADIGVNDVIGYNVLENLFYWDGTTELSDSTTAEIRVIHGAGTLGPDNIISTIGRTNSNMNLTTGNEINVIGIADGAGEFHTHLDFFLSNASPEGAYGLVFEMGTSAAGIANSETFGIMFNHGLGDAEFEAGVDFFSNKHGFNAVPEPSSLALLACTGAATCLFRRRRRA